MSDQGLLLRNVTAVTLAPPEVRAGVDVRIADGHIVEVGPGLAPASERNNEEAEGGRGEEVIDAQGQVLMPGLVVGHHHLYSALARGMPAPFRSPPTSFTQTLEKIWWRLDKALDDEGVYASALAGGLEAVRFGVTAIVDHHASPRAIPGSLDRVGAALAAVGLRGVLCYEVSDRDGPAAAEAGIAENERFLQAHRNHPRLRGMVGAHASFTLSDATLDQLADLVSRTGSGLHIHLLEDAADRTRSVADFGADPVTRLERRGLLTERALLAHGVHLSQGEAARLRAAGVHLAHNPRSNMNNRVGATPVAWLADRLVLGTDGIDGDILAEARAAFFRGREHGEPVDLSVVLGALQRSNALLSQAFGERFGVLAPGAVADLVLLDYDPPTPLAAENLAGHLGFGWGAHLVRSVLVGGSWLLRDRTFVRLDAAEAFARTRQAARALWERTQP